MRYLFLIEYRNLNFRTILKILHQNICQNLNFIRLSYLINFINSYKSLLYSKNVFFFHNQNKLIIKYYIEFNISIVSF